MQKSSEKKQNTQGKSAFLKGGVDSGRGICGKAFGRAIQNTAHQPNRR